MYGTSVEAFLSLDADILATGEGEIRLPQLLAALRDDEPLEAITGLYLRDHDGRLVFTGPAAAAPFEDLTVPDWRLASSINPPIDIASKAIQVGVETQRGCRFKCQFCTFRTLATHRASEVERAVAAISELDWLAPGSTIALTDPTATFPRDRWRAILEGLIERGGSPHSIFAYARVNDVDSEIAALMARAGVNFLFIGQESGDQKVLSKMRKGTSIAHVRPCVATLAENGIKAIFGFIHGYPGEEAESVQLTRDLICSLNDGFETKLPVLLYQLSPFFEQDLAAVNVSAPDSERFAAAVAEIYKTFIASARVAHAPFMLGVGHDYLDLTDLNEGRITAEQAFEISKLIQRGVAHFLEKDLTGRSAERDLQGLRKELLAAISSAHRPSAWENMKRRALAWVSRRLAIELAREPKRGPGLITRSLIGMLEYRLGNGTVAAFGAALSATGLDPARSQKEELAAELIGTALQAPRQAILQARANAS